MQPFTEEATSAGRPTRHGGRRLEHRHRWDPTGPHLPGLHVEVVERDLCAVDVEPSYDGQGTSSCSRSVTRALLSCRFVYCDLVNHPASALLASTGLSVDVVDVVSYLHRWIAHAGGVDKIYRWQGEVDPDARVPRLHLLQPRRPDVGRRRRRRTAAGSRGGSDFLSRAGRSPPARPRDGESQSSRLRRPAALVLAQRSRGQLKGCRVEQG